LVAAQKLADEKAAEKRAAEKRAADKLAAEKFAAERRAAEQRAADQRAAEKRGAEKREADRIASEILAAEKRAAEKLAAENLAAALAEVQNRLESKIKGQRMEALKELAGHKIAGVPLAKNVCRLCIDPDKDIRSAALDTLEQIRPDLHPEAVTFLLGDGKALGLRKITGKGKAGGPKISSKFRWPLANAAAYCWSS
jgi:hypothetical protein